ncbi:hypothetical protein MA16_Dca008292 [Dendrobium catenatum]|uniref:Protein FAR1-RELATED SEQUENCE n=1 Tax=Dendrobium catenatum TaxID=906689 RepID=A0A2I0W7X7_9ASPA|nr:hypothetical protein MA16_Dca008292 [Dendrobium catenatum]
MSIEFISYDSSKFFVCCTEKKDYSNPWVVNFDTQDESIQCTYRKFEMMGLVCSHYMRVLR